MRSAVFRLVILLALTVSSFSALALDNTLVGEWRIVNGSSRDDVGTLSATPKFFTLKLTQPKANFTAGYNQNANGDFRSTVIDKNVLVMEGRFQDRNTIKIEVMVKEIGKPEKKNFTLVAHRNK
jgi:hypothetical protein